MNAFAIGAALLLAVCSAITYIRSEKVIREHGSRWKVFAVYALITVLAAAAVFAFSDCFMIFNIAANGNMVMRILALLVYYGSLLLYGAVLWKRAYLKQ